MSAGADRWRRLILETLAIAVGVLMALAADEWNDGRRAASQERDTLTDLVQELESVRQILADTRILHVAHLESQRALLAGVQTLSSRELIEAAAELLWPRSLDAPTGALEASASSQGLGRIATDSLRSLITRWPSRYDDLTENETAELELVMQRLHPLLGDRLRVSDLVAVAGSGIAPPNAGAIDTLRLGSDLRSLMGEPQASSLIYQQFLNETVLISEYDNLSSLAELILEAAQASLVR